MLFSIRHTSPVVCIFLDSAHITRGFTSCHTRCQLLLVDAIRFAILVAGEKGGGAKGGDCANLIQLRWRGDGGEMAGRWRGDGANLVQLRMGGNGRRMGGDCANLIQLRGGVKGGGVGEGGGSAWVSVWNQRRPLRCRGCALPAHGMRLVHPSSSKSFSFFGLCVLWMYTPSGSSQRVQDCKSHRTHELWSSHSDNNNDYHYRNSAPLLHM